MKGTLIGPPPPQRRVEGRVVADVEEAMGRVARPFKLDVDVVGGEGDEPIRLSREYALVPFRLWDDEDRYASNRM